MSLSKEGTASSSPSIPGSLPNLGDVAGATSAAPEPHPVGRVRHGLFAQALRAFAFVSWTVLCVCSIHLTQWMGTPLYFLSNQELYYAYMSYTKRSFGIVVTTLTQWFSPTVVRVSGDASIRGELQQSKDGRLVCGFADRAVVIANHQLYTDWLYLWWIAYTNHVHGNIYIILKESLKWVPVVGPGMMFYGFVFMARNWLKDQPRLKHRLKKLAGDGGGKMWLLIFPEGTNLSGNTRKGSQKWAEKSGMKDFEHLLLPRSTGLGFCLRELGSSVEWVYDCTVAYEGIP